MSARDPRSEGWLPSVGDPSPIPLEAFDLLKPIGFGGVAQVWAGRHRGTGADVAVKVLTAGTAKDSEFIAGFHREIQAIAGLDHPAIVLLLDHGEVSAEVGARAGGRLTSGSPYLVMELSTEGTLKGELDKGPMGWPRIRATLLSLLDALGHAHARGLIHRDIKPDNVLGFRDAQAPWRLSDFGIAQALEEFGRDADRVMGTPGFMAPEQVRGDFRDYGPWTDLYAFGCMAYAMIWGRLPYPYPEAQRYIYAQLEGPAPRLPTPPDMPPGLDTWVHRLLERDPMARTQRAADAAFGLLALGEPAGGGAGWDAGETRLMAIPRASSPADTPTSHGDMDHLSEDLSGPTWISVGPPPTTPLPRDPTPPIPGSWQRPDAPRTHGLAEFGVRLYGLRTIPLVGREAERDRIWAALKASADDAMPRVVLIEGVAGVGKSRLAEWIAERAHEVGAATVIGTTFHEQGDVSEALANTLARHFRCVGLPRAEARERLERDLRHMGVLPAEIDLVADLMAAEASDLAGGLSTRDAVLRRLVQRMSAGRPVILLQDDVQWALEAVAFNAGLLARRGHGDARVVVIATVRSEDLSPGSRARAAVDQLLSLPGSVHIPLGPLGDTDQTRLVRELLGLQGDVVEAVVSWSGGIPEGAVQLLGSWVSRGLLVPGTGGLRLKGGKAPALPQSLTRMWSDRLERALVLRSQVDRIALELAAVLGQEAIDELWAPLCERVGLDPSVDLVESLVERRLARWREPGWAFINPTLRELLQASAKRRGRWRDHNLAAARLYEDLIREGGRHSLSERLALHLFEGGQREAAFDHLMAATQERWSRGELPAGAAVLERAERLLHMLQAPEGDPRWATLHQMWARQHMSVGDYDAAAREAELTESLATASGDAWLVAKAVQTRAAVAYRVGHYDAARALFMLAQQSFEDLGDGKALADTLIGQGEIARRQGDRRRAESFYARALGRFRAEGDMTGIARAFHCMAALARAGDVDQAQEYFERAIHFYRRSGSREPLYSCINGLAYLDVLRGNLARAEARYREALAFYDAVGGAASRVVRSNLAFLLLTQGRFREGEAMMGEVRDAMEAGGQYDHLGGVYLLLAWCAAHREDWGAFDARMDRSEAYHGLTRSVDTDDATGALEAGKLALAAGMHDRARRVLEIAREQFERLGLEGDQAKAKALLDALPEGSGG